MSVATRLPRSRPETVARRREIVRAARDVFAAKGFSNGTLIDIANQVGMTHAGVLHHFGSKEQLLLEVLTDRDESDLEHLDGKQFPSGIELFRHLVRTAFANARRAGIVQAFTVLSAESVTDGHPARDYFVARYRALRRDVAAAFAQVCADRGVTAPDTVAKASASILAVMDGLQVQWLLDPDNVDLAEASEFAIEALVAAVVNRFDPVL